MKFKKLTLMQWKRIIFYATFLTMVMLVLFNTNNNLVGSKVFDEKVYEKLTRDIHNGVNGSSTIGVLKHWKEVKPATFVELQYILRAYETVKYTRALNVVLILLITIFIYDLSKRKEAILFPLIPIFLNSMWLTAEIIEIMFVILAIKYSKFSGILVGLATIFRPYAILYTYTLKKKQLIPVLLIGSMYALFLIYHNWFWGYLERLIEHNVSEPQIPDLIAFEFLILFVIIGWKTSTTKYVLASVLPLTMLGAHYFLPIYTWLFLGYLMEITSKPKNMVGEKYDNG